MGRAYHTKEASANVDWVVRRPVLDALEAETPHLEADLDAGHIYSELLEEDTADLGVLYNVENVDRPVQEDSLLTAYAVRVLVGTTDMNAHDQNIQIMQDGTAYPIDFMSPVSPLDTTYQHLVRRARRSVERLPMLGLEIGSYGDLTQYVADHIASACTAQANTVDIDALEEEIAAIDEDRYTGNIQNSWTQLKDNLQTAQDGNWDELKQDIPDRDPYLQTIPVE